MKLFHFFASSSLAASFCDPSHAMVVDAGSKGTRLLIFAINGTSWGAETVPKVVAVKSVHPGISFFALEPEKLRGLLQELLEFAEKHLRVKRKYWKTFPIYLKGTAGMRDLLPARRDAVMDQVQQVLATSSFFFHKRQATVISGEEEAAFAWLTLNTHRSSLNSHGDSSFGVLDLGGASLQVAFTPLKSHYVLEHFFPMDLDRENGISLYAKSYLHYGSVEANRRLDSLIISNALLQVESLSEIDNPCFSKGMNYTPDFSTNLFKIPVNVWMRGSGDQLACRKLIEQLMTKQTSCWVKDCTFDGVYQPRLEKRKFVAISSFAKTVTDLGLQPTTSLAKLREAAEEVCHMTVSELEENFIGLKEAERIDLCFTSTYVHTLLTHGLGFDDSEPGQIEFLREDSKGAVDWALGALIWELNRTPPQIHCPGSNGPEAAELRKEAI